MSKNGIFVCLTAAPSPAGKSSEGKTTPSPLQRVDRQSKQKSGASSPSSFSSSSSGKGTSLSLPLCLHSVYLSSILYSLAFYIHSYSIFTHILYSLVFYIHSYSIFYCILYSLIFY